jgi:hypothetical protein
MLASLHDGEDPSLSFAGGDAAIPIGPDRDLDLDGMTPVARRSLSATRHILSAFEQGKDMSWVFQAHSDLYAIGTAYAIWTLASRRMCDVHLSAQSLLHEATREHLRRPCPWPEDPGQTRLTRDRTIASLKAVGILGKRQSVRDIKTVSTVASIAEVATEVARSQRVCVDDIASARRSREIARARFMMIYVLRHACGHSLNFIGRNLGARDHTTILSGLNTITLLMRQDDAVRKTLNRICHDVDLIALQRFRRQVLFPDVVNLRRNPAALDAPR